MPVGGICEVHGDREDRGPGAQRQGRRSAGQGGVLAEELDVDATAADAAIGQQTDDLVAFERLQRRPSGVRPERDDRHPQGGAQLCEPLEQLGRVDPFDDHRHRNSLIGEPPAGPFPTPEVRQREDPSGFLLGEPP